LALVFIVCSCSKIKMVSVRCKKKPPGVESGGW
jgi:hypothetical protein